MNKEYKMPELENIAEETKEFLQKPRYVYCEDKKYIVDTELDVLVDMDGVIDRLNTQCFQKKELLRNIRIKDKQIADLQHRLEVAEKALELACGGLKYFKEMLDREMGLNDFFGYEINYDLQGIIEQYKGQAEKEVKGE